LAKNNEDPKTILDTDNFNEYFIVKRVDQDYSKLIKNSRIDAIPNSIIKINKDFHVVLSRTPEKSKSKNFFEKELTYIGLIENKVYNNTQAALKGYERWPISQFHCKNLYAFDEKYFIISFVLCDTYTESEL